MCLPHPSERTWPLCLTLSRMGSEMSLRELVSDWARQIPQGWTPVPVKFQIPFPLFPAETEFDRPDMSGNASSTKCLAVWVHADLSNLSSPLRCSGTAPLEIVPLFSLQEPVMSSSTLCLSCVCVVSSVTKMEAMVFGYTSSSGSLRTGPDWCFPYASYKRTYDPVWRVQPQLLEESPRDPQKQTRNPSASLAHAVWSWEVCRVTYADRWPWLHSCFPGVPPKDLHDQGKESTGRC